MPRSVTLTLGDKAKQPSFEDLMRDVRNLITVAMGTMKELKASAVSKYKAPGMRIIIGEILSCLGHAKSATSIDPGQFNFKKL